MGCRPFWAAVPRSQRQGWHAKVAIHQGKRISRLSLASRIGGTAYPGSARARASYPSPPDSRRPLSDAECLRATASSRERDQGKRTPVAGWLLSPPRSCPSPRSSRANPHPGLVASRLAAGGASQAQGDPFRRAQRQGKHVIHPIASAFPRLPLYPDAAPRAISLPWLTVGSSSPRMAADGSVAGGWGYFSPRPSSG